jgi:hypothetical protein
MFYADKDIESLLIILIIHRTLHFGLALIVIYFNPVKHLNNFVLSGVDKILTHIFLRQLSFDTLISLYLGYE